MNSPNSLAMMRNVFRIQTFSPIAMGIVLGVLFGKLNISFSDSFSFSPGLTGGILMVALVLSAIGKTGPIIWSMSGSANNLLRQLGLLLFLSEVGTSAGVNLVFHFPIKRFNFYSSRYRYNNDPYDYSRISWILFL